MGYVAETCDIYVEVCAETESALCVEGGPPAIWLPRSQIDPDESELDRGASLKGEQGHITIPRWLAEAKSLV